MAAPAQGTGLTYADLESFPDDGLRRELIGGELIVTASPRPAHQATVVSLTTDLKIYVRVHGGRVFPAPLDVKFSDIDVLEPDVLVVTAAREHIIKERFLDEAPDIVVEVSSPSTRRLELVRKRAVYERYAVAEYWYVDLDADRVERYRLTDGRYPTPTLLGRDDELTTPLLPGFAVHVGGVLDGA